MSVLAALVAASAFAESEPDSPRVSYAIEADAAAYALKGYSATGRVGYRFRGPMKNGPAVDAIAIDQNWRLRSEKTGGETRFRPLGVGNPGGYYFHIGKHFYIYPTASFTYNLVYSGSTNVGSQQYKVSRWQPDGSVHVGCKWGR